MTSESSAPLTPTTPEERAVMRAYCGLEKGHWLDRPINFAFGRRARIDFPRVLADLERALERIEKAPHAITCEANYQGRFPCNCWKSEVD